MARPYSCYLFFPSLCFLIWKMRIGGSSLGLVKDKRKGNGTGQKTPYMESMSHCPPLGSASCMFWVLLDFIYLHSLYVPYLCLCVSVMAVQRGLVSSLSQGDPKASVVPAKLTCPQGSIWTQPKPEFKKSFSRKLQLGS